MKLETLRTVSHRPYRVTCLTDQLLVSVQKAGEKEEEEKNAPDPSTISLVRSGKTKGACAKKKVNRVSPILIYIVYACATVWLDWLDKTRESSVLTPVESLGWSEEEALVSDRSLVDWFPPASGGHNGLLEKSLNTGVLHRSLSAWSVPLIEPMPSLSVGCNMQNAAALGTNQSQLGQPVTVWTSTAEDMDKCLVPRQNGAHEGWHARLELALLSLIAQVLWDRWKGVAARRNRTIKPFSPTTTGDVHRVGLEMVSVTGRYPPMPFLASSPWTAIPPPPSPPFVFGFGGDSTPPFQWVVR